MLYWRCRETQQLLLYGGGTTMDRVQKMRAITAAQIALAVLVAAALGWYGLKQMEYAGAQQVYDEIAASYASTADSGSTSAVDCPVDLEALNAEFPALVGWLQVDDLDLGYPIAQADDNDYYLHNDLAGNPSIDGCLFLDYRNNSFDDDLHALVYGHNMLDGSMFGTLQSYTSEDFLRNGTGTFTIYTPAATYQYRIFSIQIVDPQDEAYAVGFKTHEVFDGFVRQLGDDSLYDTGVQAGGTDHVVTLSTCSNQNRLIVSGKRIQG